MWGRIKKKIMLQSNFYSKSYSVLFLYTKNLNASVLDYKIALWICGECCVIHKG